MSTLRAFLIVIAILAAYSSVVAVFTVPYLWIAAVLIVIALAVKKKPFNAWAYGTARWATVEDVPHMIDGHGIIIGFLTQKMTRMQGMKALFDFKRSCWDSVQACLMSFNRKERRILLRLNNVINTLVIAPTGAGKGVSIILPFLLTCLDCMVIFDPKGENFKFSAAVQRRMGKLVFCLDPFNMVGGKDSLSPMEIMDANLEKTLDLIRSLAESVVVRTGEEKDPHWNDSAQEWIAGMIALVVAHGMPGEKNLQFVRGLLTDTAKMQAAIQMMKQSTAFGGMLARMGGKLEMHKDRELGSVLTTVNRHLSFLDSPAIARATTKSTFDPSVLTSGKAVVYIVLPPEYLRTQSGLLRMWINTMFGAVVKAGLSNRRRVQFVIDEAASLGHMDIMLDALTQFRGYGVRLLLAYQSLGQLRECFPNGQDQTVLSNTSQIVFAVNDSATADFVSNRLGTWTQTVSSGGGGYSASRKAGTHELESHSHSENWGWQQAQRELLKSSEVMQLDPRIALTFTPNSPPLATWLARFYEGQPKQGIGVMRAVIETAALFLTTAAVAVMLTMAALKH